MSVLRGHEDLKPKAIVGFDMGFALVQDGTDVLRYRLLVGPTGNLLAQPEPVQEGTQVDQLTPLPPRPLRHWAVDQVGFNGLDQVE
jgi:hypothetical protein